MSVFIIAEAGDNHNGDYATALKLVDAAVKAGADCVKFQTFVTEELVTENAEKAEYQIENDKSSKTQYEMIKNLELSFDEFVSIKKYCDSKGILFLSTSFDMLSVDFLASLNLPIWKIPSGEITNLPYLIKIAKLGKPVILSTGMATIDEIEAAVNILEKNDSGEITILHCNTAYPTPYHDVNLLAMTKLRSKFNKKVGYSDHTLGIEVPIAAVALGATIVEKHFTLDREMNGPDHKASLEPQELITMVKSIRNIENAMGSGLKQPTASELVNKDIARKSIVARCEIEEGELFTELNLTCKRPGTGISPMKWFEVINTKATKKYKKDDLIEV